MTTIYVPAIASSLLCISFILYSLGLFSNYWLYLEVNENNNGRLGLYESCEKGRGCTRYADREALSFEMVAFVLNILAIFYMVYLLMQKSKLQDGSFKYKLRFLLLLYIIVSLTHITGWAKFAESRKDFASQASKAGYSNYLTVISFALNILTLIAILAVQFLKNRFNVLIFSMALSAVSAILFGVGIFTDYWVVNTNVSSIEFHNGLFVSCVADTCVKNKLSMYLALELVGFVVLLSATFLSLLSAFFKVVFADEKQFVKWIITLVLTLISLAFIIAGWASFAMYKKDDINLAKFKFDWSFYIIIGTITANVLSAIVCVIEIIKNKDE